jgi:hypothetical protein
MKKLTLMKKVETVDKLKEDMNVCGYSYQILYVQIMIRSM